jgi:OmpA-OmpF porin, OOP family
MLIVPIAIMLAIGCASNKTQTVYPNMFTPYAFDAKGYSSKADHFLVILDASSSMLEPYSGQPKFKIAKDFLSAMNQTVPDISLDGALRSFGHNPGLSKKTTALFYGLTGYTKNGFEEALGAVEAAGGTSPMAAAINAAGDDLSAAKGKVALIIVSDGKDMNNAPVAAAENLSSKFGNRLCIYTVLIANDTGGESLLSRISDAGECGFSARADEMTSSTDMADFVEKVFLGKRLDTDGDGVYDDMDDCPGTPAGTAVDQKGCPLDSDGDGVYDDMDQCPGTPAGAAVDQKGCPLDSDGDGVYDYEDQCLGTPRGVAVLANGCPYDNDGDGVRNSDDQCPDTPKGATVNKLGCWVLTGVNFDSGKWEIKPEMHGTLNRVVEVLEGNPGVKVEIQGHTDNVGAKGFNQQLSENRAKAVMDYLASHGIQKYRLSAKGYGLANPIANNETAEGRATNRRVELKPVY